MPQPRLTALRACMRDTGTDLVALGPGPHMHWLAGFHPHADERPCLLMVSQSHAGFLMPALNAAGSRAHTDLPFWLWSDAEGPGTALARALHDLGIATGARVGLDESMRADFALLLLGAIPGARHGFAADTLGKLRLRKDGGEQAELRREAAIADAAMRATFAALEPGLSERDLATIARDHFRASGANPLFTIIGAGPNGAFPHHQTGQTLLRAGDAVVIDIGARSGDFSSDITRMAILGDGPEGYQLVHDVVERAVQAALSACKPGARARDVDRAARTVITDAGFGPQFVHRTGHGLGLEGHEPPWITETSDTVLEPGMVFSIEPGIYLEGRFGIRLEEIVILHEDGPEVLSQLPRQVHRAPA